MLGGLCCAVLCCAVLCCAVLCCERQHAMILAEYFASHPGTYIHPFGSIAQLPFFRMPQLTVSINVGTSVNTVMSLPPL